MKIFAVCPSFVSSDWIEYNKLFGLEYFDSFWNMWALNSFFCTTIKSADKSMSLDTTLEYLSNENTFLKRYLRTDKFHH